MIPVWVVIALVVAAYILGLASFVIFDAASEQRSADKAVNK